jgi:hypothetical protein
MLTYRFSSIVYTKVNKYWRFTVLEKKKNQLKHKVDIGEVRKSEADEVKNMMLLNAINEKNLQEELKPDK